MVTSWISISPPTGPDILDLGALEFPCVEGRTYILRFTVTGRTVGSVEAGTGAAAETVTASSNGDFSLTFVSTGTGTEGVFFNTSGGFNGVLSNQGIFELNGTSWTSISSPIQPSWTTVAAPGGSWTTVPVPTGASSVVTGYAYGLLMAITRPETTYTDGWTQIAEPSTAWTTVPKAT